VNHRSRLALGLVATGLAIMAGCTPGHTESARNGEQDKPAKVERIEGTDLSRVVLNQRAADRVGIKTEPVRQVSTPGAGPQSPAVPVAALVYDDSGDIWVYTVTRPLTYMRQRVAVARIEGDLAVLESGPAPGTAVVTVGAAELLGSEYGVEGQ
jgi:hypothetical protein